MQRHLFLAVSEQKAALNGVYFVGHFFTQKQAQRLTLFYTLPKPPAVWEDDRSTDAQHRSEAQAKKNEERGRQAIANAEQELVRLGYRQDQIDSKLQKRKFTKLIDIIQEGEQGCYDAVLLGRRGRSWLEEAMDESVSKGILKAKVGFPIWVCRKENLDRKQVLVCVDGSDAAYRMADHVGFILAPEKEKEITLLVVGRKSATAAGPAQDILAKSREKLVQNGIPEQMIAERIVDSSNAGKSICDQARRGQYAVVAVGRRGTGRTGFLMGSVSRKVFKVLEESTLWICY